MRCVLATRNRHKHEELAAILRAEDLCGLELVTLLEFPSAVAPDETGATFAENARIKALDASRVCGGYALADDSGLVVDALDGAPGVHSARYAGPDASDADRINQLLTALHGVPDDARSARFVCAMALAHEGSVVLEVEAACEGRIAPSPVGAGGFGYDPVFIVDGTETTMAEVGQDAKNRISHRARAVRALRPDLLQLMSSSGIANADGTTGRAD